MKANELMIGDYVRFKHGIDKVVGVSWVPGLVDCAWFAASATLFPESVEDVNPIPLTPEILEKNGFKEISCGTSYVYGLTDDYYTIAIDELSDSIWRVEYLNREFNLPLCRNTVSFVHELQHALRLYGIEKEIEIEL